ncbi:MAG: glycine cleavage system aminomethyltransferase GcvT [Deltaproteobacteria bacterium]|nr:MAG: glycine cleavage system aminomethyltransferase GcvT [Deltaproteobacteria bacterium]
MVESRRTPLYRQHMALGAKIVDFAGWTMPLHYKTGIINEHLATRRGAGLFDVSHMGRFIFRGSGALNLLQHTLSNNAEALTAQWIAAQYTIIPNDQGGALDDAYLYRFRDNEYLLVVNAANTQKDWDYFQSLLDHFKDVEMEDMTDHISMLSLQGPSSRSVLESVMDRGNLPEPIRNAASTIIVSGKTVHVTRTGYTGEPLGFELFVDSKYAVDLWNRLLEQGAEPIGLGARDTLRLEACLPLYGHELGIDPEGKEIPIMALPQARPAVSFSPSKGNFVGRALLERQLRVLKKIMAGDCSTFEDLPRLIRPIAVTGRGVARQGARVYREGRHVGFVTSGTMIPMWSFEGKSLSSGLGDSHQLRSIALAYLDSNVADQDPVAIEIRGKMVQGIVVPYHLRSEAPPYARPIVPLKEEAGQVLDSRDTPRKVSELLQKSIQNTFWRQRECINLIPSEMTPSPMVRLLSIMDPAFRYAEHRKIKAFYDMEVFFYQGTDFIAQVELLLQQELAQYLGCTFVETRPISGQIANMAVFSALGDYLNRLDRKQGPRRIRMVMNNHINKGGHLSAQPMGALRDYVAWDPKWERPAVVNFPVLADNPYKIDLKATLELLDYHRPELIVFGKSMFIHKEPVAEVCEFLKQNNMDAVVLCDMAHVLGLIGPYFQEPFKEGADLVTGSTHKTFFGTQRGIIATHYEARDLRYELWEAIERRTFPGSVSNHHLGTLLGLLMAAYEMNHFKDRYQPKVIQNAKAFALALKNCGMNVAGDPALEFTETHQVILRVGYGRGPEIAKRLEQNNIICNYQACPDEEGFTASGALRLGVSEMTRFGMEPEDFEALADLMHAVIIEEANVKDQVKALRSRFLELKYCFRKEDYADLMQKLHELL